uniref:Uncharacterized protein n=1 Tax=Schistocephalus solidus TaxID=70667 RepID=A0A0X3P4W5_SCHSO
MEHAVKIVEIDGPNVTSPQRHTGVRVDDIGFIKRSFRQLIQGVFETTWFRTGLVSQSSFRSPLSHLLTDPLLCKMRYRIVTAVKVRSQNSLYDMRMPLCAVGLIPAASHAVAARPVRETRMTISGFSAVISSLYSTAGMDLAFQPRFFCQRTFLSPLIYL